MQAGCSISIRPVTSLSVSDIDRIPEAQNVKHASEIKISLKWSLNGFKENRVCKVATKRTFIFLSTGKVHQVYRRILLNSANIMNISFQISWIRAFLY